MMYIWIGLTVLFIITEAATMGLTVIWFGVGSLAAAIVSTFTDNIVIQMIVFVVISAISLVLTKPLLAKWKGKHIPTNADRIIGSDAYVTEEINHLEGKGQIKINGIEWTARSESHEVIPCGEVVAVLRIEGVKAIVSRKGNEK